MIPKIIHFCWFSGEKYPVLIKQCIKSWKKRMPDYRIMLWTYEMAEATEILYVKEALEQKNGHLLLM